MRVLCPNQLSFVLSLIGGFSFVPMVAADHKYTDPKTEKSATPIPAETIGKWTQRGAIFGWYGKNQWGNLQFTADRAELSEAIPAFEFPDASDADLKQLPAIDQPFALNFSFAPVTDLGLQELRMLPSLVVLDLTFTKLTDAGLRKLNNLTQLESLNLCGTKITDGELQNAEGCPS